MSQYIECPDCGVDIEVSLSETWEGDPSIPNGTRTVWDAEIIQECECELTSDQEEDIINEAIEWEGTY